MSILPVILWSDALVFLLLLCGFGGTLYIRRRAHLRVPWQRLARRPVAMVSLMVLSLFVLIGLLDTLHYRAALPDSHKSEQTVYSPEVLSVLDTLLQPLRVQTETTYSAPLAIHAYAKDSLTNEAGEIERVYPRLLYGGAHIQHGQDHRLDVLQRAIAGVVAALALWGLLWAVLWAVLARSRYRLREFAAILVIRALLYSSAVLLMLIGVVVSLAQGYHVLGTDKVGQDVLYLALKSIRTGLVIGTVTTLIMLPLAIVMGIAAGYFRGWVDDVIQYIYTVLNSIPGVLLIVASVLMVQVMIETNPGWFETAAERADMRLVCLCLILGITSWTGLCRLLRGETLKLREMEYIQAAQAFHVSNARILSQHIMPNVMHIILIALVLDFSGLVLAEAVLSYIGVGVDPSMISFGNMINAARLEMSREPMVWWSLVAAFGFMLALVLSANLFADAVRDAFDPRLNRH